MEEVHRGTKLKKGGKDLGATYFHNPEFIHYQPYRDVSNERNAWPENNDVLFHSNHGKYKIAGIPGNFRVDDINHFIPQNHLNYRHSPSAPHYHDQFSYSYGVNKKKSFIKDKDRRNEKKYYPELYSERRIVYDKDSEVLDTSDRQILDFKETGKYGYYKSRNLDSPGSKMYHTKQLKIYK